MTRFLAFAALFLASSLAQAEAPRKYAVLSLLGDSLTVVQREMSTGTRIDRNTRTPVPMNSPALDNAMVLAVEKELLRMEPAAQVVLMAARRPELYALQSRSLEDSAAMKNLVAAVRDVAAKADATHLILVSKHRARARLEVPDGALGDGQLEGLGFYVDPTRSMDTLTAGERTEGFIASYAYFVVTLVDLKTGAILAQRNATESQSAANQRVLTPWQALTPEQKASMLEQLIVVGAGRAVPKVLKGG